MRVTTRAEYRLSESGDYVLVAWEGYEYEGPVAMLGGGPSSEQRDAARAQADSSRQASANSTENNKLFHDQYAKVNAYAEPRLQNGLPFFPAMTDYNSGVNAQAFAPARATLNRNLTSMGDLPSGFKAASLADFESNRARAFDDSLMQSLFQNEQAKQQAAQVMTGQGSQLNPIGWTQAAMQGNQSIMQAPLQSPGIGGLLGGIAGGAMSAIPGF